MRETHQELNKALMDLQNHLDTEGVRLMKTVISLELESVKTQMIDYPTTTNSGRAQAWRKMLQSLEQKSKVDNQDEITY